MNIGTYSTNEISKLLWLISGVVAVIFIALGIFIYNKIIEGSYQESKLYQTALQITNKDQFNYSIDSRQGNILAYGEFSGINLVKFPEMNKHFTYVQKIKEEYTKHEEEVCEEDSEGNETCHTEVSYSWDRKGSEEISVEKILFMDKEYLYNIFDFQHTERINASEIINGETDKYYYPEKKKTSFLGFENEDEGDIRYYFRVIHPKINGSIFINSYNGTLQPIQGKKITVQKETINERINNIRSSANLARWAFTIFWVFLTIGAVIFTTVALYQKI